MPRHCPKSFWSLKLDFDNDFPAKTPKLYSTTTTMETPKFWPISKCTDPPINVADKLGNKTQKTETLVRYLIH